MWKKNRQNVKTFQLSVVCDLTATVYYIHCATISRSSSFWQDSIISIQVFQGCHSFTIKLGRNVEILFVYPTCIILNKIISNNLGRITRAKNFFFHFTHWVFLFWMSVEWPESVLVLSGLIFILLWIKYLVGRRELLKLRYCWNMK